MSGTTGKVMALIPKTVTFALMASLIEAFLILPSHYIDLHRLTGSQRPEKKSKRISLFINKIYLPFVRFFVYYRYRCVFLFCFVLIAGLVIFLSIRPIPIILFPSDHHDFWITARLEEKRPIVYTAKKIKKIEKIIESLPKDEIMNYTLKIGEGSNENYEVIFSSGIAQFTVTLNPYRKSERSTDEIMQDVRKRIAKADLKEFLYVTVDHLPEGPQQGKAVAIRGLAIDVVGTSVEDAVTSSIGLEEIAKMMITALQVGTPKRFEKFSMSPRPPGSPPSPESRGSLLWIYYTRRLADSKWAINL